MEKSLNPGATNERCDIELEVINNTIEHLLLMSPDIP